MTAKIYEEKSKATGKTSLILIRTIDGVRIKTSLKLQFKTNPSTFEEREEKKEKMIIARKIANEETKRMLNGEYMLQEDYRITEDFIAYAVNFINQHAVKDKRKYWGVLNRLKTFFGKDKIPAFEMTEIAMQRFAKSLENELKGESAHNYFSKLKQIIDAATEELLFRNNPTRRIRVKQYSYIVKEVLTTEEIRRLYDTFCGNDNVRRAFLFALTTGLRWVDIKQLLWKNIQSKSVSIIQSKTQSRVTIPLNNDALCLLGEKGNSESLIFKLPSHTGALKIIRNWTRDAGIEKHITFHCARHSYGTEMIAQGIDISIASKLLGHTNISTSQRYVRISDSLKQQAIQKLPSFTF
ncbi:hypothetical protein CJD36_016890 [Flavipsychrobacter stenotrophus]|uniref:Tyr recombinase domain-containing protein n=1 Tax=Flavipsychrobacter stenotrophus TaxID=2077091 RepID=A0A2S7SSN0_9BACT|nr:site-specific integrase [Flavipsychrobacter stenotrophus]PQJ09615.1 hypothetical protein CJD36_016890 [Flavipsychrobacter stenotrophus]